MADARSDIADRELVFEREFDAPRELVWRCWTEVEHLVHWWGPDGFRTTYEEMDVRPGGVARFVMHGWDRDWPNKMWFHEVDPPRPGRGRTHIDVSVPADQAEKRLKAALAGGGRLVRGSDEDRSWTIASPDNHGVDIAGWADFQA